MVRETKDMLSGCDGSEELAEFNNPAVGMRKAEARVGEARELRACDRYRHLRFAALHALGRLTADEHDVERNGILGLRLALRPTFRP